MKGMLYSALILNKKVIIGSTLGMLGAALICAILIHCGAELVESGFSVGLEICLVTVIAQCIMSEFLDRDFIKNVKNGSLAYNMCAGVSAKRLALSELLKNLIVCSFTTAFSTGIMFIYHLVNSTYVTMDHVLIIAALGFSMSFIDWILLPLALKLRDAEKAGFILGLILGFAVVCPVFIIIRSLEISTEQILTFVKSPEFIVPCVLVILAAYAVSFLILSRQCRKGALI